MGSASEVICGGVLKTSLTGSANSLKPSAVKASAVIASAEAMLVGMVKANRCAAVSLPELLL